MSRRLITSGLATLLALACSPQAARAEPAPALPAVAAPTRAQAWAARLVVPTWARREGGAGRRVRLDTRAAWNGGPQQLLVLEVRPARTGGGRELRLLLGGRPNGSSAWVREDRVALVRIDERVEIDRRARTVTLRRAGRRVARWRAVVGARRTPTPAGRFAIYETVRQPDPGAFLGPWALHITAHSGVLDDYGGGPGRVALHGRAGVSLLDRLGSARSHGCIRLPNAAIARLAREAVPGTPVAVT